MFTSLSKLSPKHIRERIFHISDASPSSKQRRNRKRTTTLDFSSSEEDNKDESDEGRVRGEATTGTVDFDSEDEDRTSGGPSTCPSMALAHKANSGRELLAKAWGHEDSAAQETSAVSSNASAPSRALTLEADSTRKKKTKKSRFAMGELNFDEINLSSQRKDAERMPDGPNMSLNATTFRFHKELVITKDGFRRHLIDEKISKKDFVVIKELGRGAGGVVYKAIHIDSMRLVAIKYVRATDAVKRGQIWHELEALTDNFESLSETLTPLRECSDDQIRQWLYTIHFGPYSKQVKYIAAMSSVKGLGELLETCETRKDLARFIKSSLHQKLLLHAVKAAKERGGIRVPARCPYIIRFHGAYLDPDKKNTVCVVIEYMDGGDLQHFVDAGVHCKETLIASIAFRMLKGLEFLHDQRQIHRDIKPANALVTKRGDVKVSDYGIAKKTDVGATSGSGSDEFQTFTGTTIYMSPERLDGKSYGYNADVWSLGISLIALYLGRIPFSDKAKASFFNLRNEIFTKALPRLPGATEDFQSFVDRCTCVDKTKRADVKELLSHKFITSHVDEIYDTRNYKRWVKDRLQATKLENTKRMSTDTLLEETEKKARAAVREMSSIAKKLVAAYKKRGGLDVSGSIGSLRAFEGKVRELADRICAEFVSESGDNPVADKAIRKFGKELRRSKIFEPSTATTKKRSS